MAKLSCLTNKDRVGCGVCKLLLYSGDFRVGTKNALHFCHIERNKMLFYRVYQTPEIYWSTVTETATPFNPLMLISEEYVGEERRSAQATLTRPINSAKSTESSKYGLIEGKTRIILSPTLLKSLAVQHRVRNAYLFNCLLYELNWLLLSFQHQPLVLVIGCRLSFHCFCLDRNYTA